MQESERTALRATLPEGGSVESLEKPRGALFLIRNPKDGTFLLELRDGNCKYFPHQWNFPGEHRRDEEDAGDAAVRGALEEFGLALKKDDLVPFTDHPQPHAPGTVKVYLVTLPEGQNPICNEAAGMRWFSLEEIRGMSLGFGQGAFVPALAERFSV